MAKIFINPGNGSTDPGAVGKTGLKESNVAFAVGNMTADYLRAVGYEALVLQSDDLSGVIRKANESGSDLFVSIHCNSFGDPQANGTETIYFGGSRQGEKIARFIQNQLISELGLSNRGIKTMQSMNRVLGVLRDSTMPSALTELAFISNPKEEQLLKNEQDRFAKAVAREISDYYS